MKLLSFFLAIAALISLLACSKNEPKAPLNPNGDSEMALLMRAMFDDGMKVREQILNGEKPQATVDFEKIFSAKPTTPEMVEIPGFDAYATSYVQAMQALQTAGAENARPLYEAMVASCMNCHNAGCTGPIMRIKKMILPGGK